MVIQMTRAEYEAKYGSAPTSTPTQMTRAQYEATYGSAPSSTPTSTPPAAPQGILSRVIPQLGQALADRKKNVLEAKTRATEGKQTHAEGIFQTAGQGIGLASDAGFTVAKEAVRSVAPSVIPVVKKTIGAAMQTAPAQAAMGAYGDFKEKHPRAAANIEAVGNFAEIIPQGYAAKIGAKLAGKSIVEGTEIAAKGAAKAGQAAKSTPSRVASVLSNVPKEDFEFAANPQYAPLVERAMKYVGENEKQPYFELANRTASAINKADEDASRALQQAKLDFKSADPKASFDVRPYKHELAGQLRDFAEYGLELRGEKNFKIAKTAQSPFTEKELGALNGLLEKINASDELDIDNLLALSKSLNAAYDEVPLGVNGTPRPYHAVLMSIKAPTERFIDNILPPNLRAAFDKYRMIQEMKSEIGNKVIDGQGNLKDTAEQFLGNLGNANKGNVRLNADNLRALTGVDINTEVRALKVAQRFSNVFPATGSRTQDVFRSIIASGLGGMTLGPAGIALGAAVTSPKLLGKAAVRIGKSRAEGGAAQRMGDYLKNVQPGLSLKDVSREALEDARDFIIKKLEEHTKDLNIDLQLESDELLTSLRERANITTQDVNRAMEILRLQGKTDAIDGLRRTLGASTEKPRDDLGRWVKEKKPLGGALRRPALDKDKKRDQR